jgi:hypothetical protein
MVIQVIILSQNHIAMTKIYSGIYLVLLPILLLCNIAKSQSDLTTGGGEIKGEGGRDIGNLYLLGSPNWKGSGEREDGGGVRIYNFKNNFL